MYIIWAHLALIPLYLVLLFLSYKAKFLKRLTNYIGTYLFWNGSIRLYIELYQDFAINSSLNMYKIERDSPFADVRLSNTYAFISFTLVCAIPIVIFIPFYCYNKAKWLNIGF